MLNGVEPMQHVASSRCCIAASTGDSMGILPRCICDPLQRMGGEFDKRCTAHAGIKPRPPKPGASYNEVNAAALALAVSGRGIRSDLDLAGKIERYAEAVVRQRTGIESLNREVADARNALLSHIEEMVRAAKDDEW